MNSRAAARALERRFPVFGQRLLTLTEARRDQPGNPFLVLLAESALSVARDLRPAGLIGQTAWLRVTATGACGGIGLAWLVFWGSGAIAGNARALWFGQSPFRIELKPGHQTVRRGSDLAVTARLGGFSAQTAELRVRVPGSSKWTKATMRAEGGSEFRVNLTRLSGDVEFYAESEGVQSAVARVHVLDLPAVKRITVTYDYPPDSGAEADSHAAGTAEGDVAAPAGTVATLEIETDRPMSDGRLVLENGDTLTLPATRGNKTSVKLRVLRDGGYHVGVTYGSEDVAVSDEHAIEMVTRDQDPGPGVALTDGARAGPVPSGYERAVADYYRRLADAQNIRQSGR